MYFVVFLFFGSQFSLFGVNEKYIVEVRSHVSKISKRLHIIAR